MLSLLCTISLYFFGIFFSFSSAPWVWVLFFLQSGKRTPPHIFFALKNLFGGAFFAIYAAWSIFIFIRNTEVETRNINTWQKLSICYVEIGWWCGEATHVWRIRNFGQRDAKSWWLQGFHPMWTCTPLLYMFWIHGICSRATGGNRRNGMWRFFFFLLIYGRVIQSMEHVLHKIVCVFILVFFFSILFAEGRETE